MAKRITFLFAVLISCAPVSLLAQQSQEGHCSLFSQAMRQTYPPATLDYVEAAYNAHLNGDNDGSGRFDGITFVYGSWESLAAVTDSTSCTISLLYGRLYNIEWKGLAQVEFPVAYDRILGANRSQIEDNFLERLRRGDAVPACHLPVDSLADSLDAKGYYIVRGDKYGLAEVNRDAYLVFNEDSVLSTIYSVDYPAETMADLFVCGSDSQSVALSFVVPKHDYGTVDSVATTVEQLRQVCAADGCLPFWGTESITDDKLCGTVFFYNQALGYDHVLRVECDPRQIGTDDFSITGRMSLFVPTNNVKDLYEVVDPNVPKKHISYE